MQPRVLRVRLELGKGPIFDLEITHIRLLRRKEWDITTIAYLSNISSPPDSDLDVLSLDPKGPSERLLRLSDGEVAFDRGRRWHRLELDAAKLDPALG